MKITTTITQEEDKAPKPLQKLKNGFFAALIFLIFLAPWISTNAIPRKVVFGISLLWCAAIALYQLKYISRRKIEILLLELHENQLTYAKPLANVNGTGKEISHHTISLSKIERIELFNDLIVFEGERYFSNATYFKKKQFSEVESFVKKVLENHPHISFIHHK